MSSIPEPTDDASGWAERLRSGLPLRMNKPKEDGARKEVAEQEARKKADEDAKRAADAKVARDAAAECDRLAASPIDAMRPSDVTGVELSKIDAQAAWSACNNAMRLNPNVPRLIHQASRAAAARKNFTEAIGFYRTAADQGSAAAMNSLGFVYSQESRSGTMRRQRAGTKKGLRYGNAAAMTGLGTLYHNGQGVTRNLAAASVSFDKAAALGEAYAMGYLGLLAETG